MRHLMALFLVAPLALLFIPGLVPIASGQPWWTERSSFVEGDTLYAVGVASHVTTIEGGRQTAYENGKKEIQNFRQSAVLDDLQIMTQMTYEERNEDGTFSVYRLLRVPVSILGTLPKRNPSTPTYTPSSPPVGPSRWSSVGPSDCEGMTYSPEKTDCYRAAREAGDADRAKHRAMEQAAHDADDQQLAQKNPEEYQRRMALRAAAKRVETEKAEIKKACWGLQKGFTREEVALAAGKSISQEAHYGSVEYLGGRLTLHFDSFGRLDSLGNCPRF